MFEPVTYVGPILVKIWNIFRKHIKLDMKWKWKNNIKERHGLLMVLLFYSGTLWSFQDFEPKEKLRQWNFRQERESSFKL